MLGNLSKEERLANLEKARISREKKKEAGKHLRQAYVDEAYHRKTASKFGLRMPASYISACNTKHLKRVMKKLEINPSEWLAVEGYKSLADFGRENPTVSAAEHIGILLEWYCENGSEEWARN